MALCNVSGIGGGGLLISLIMFFFAFPTKESTSISSFAILASSIVRFIIQFKHKHPEKDAVIIDYGIAAIMLPTVLIGSFIGAFINVTFPALALTIVLTAVLIGLSGFSILKAKQAYDKETDQIKTLKLKS